MWSCGAGRRCRGACGDRPVHRTARLPRSRRTTASITDACRCRYEFYGMLFFFFRVCICTQTGENDQKKKRKRKWTKTEFCFIFVFFFFAKKKRRRKEEASLISQSSCGGSVAHYTALLLKCRLTAMGSRKDRFPSFCVLITLCFFFFFVSFLLSLSRGIRKTDVSVYANLRQRFCWTVTTTITKKKK